MLRVTSLNLNGIRSAFRKGLQPWMDSHAADVLCLQEIKIAEADLTDELRQPPGYTGHFHHAQKKGYSGVGIYLKQPAERVVIGLDCEEFDPEGRVIRADWAGVSIISAYLPSGSSGDERQQAKYRFLDKFGPWMDALMDEHRTTGREFIICGDWNIAHKEIDIKNWKGNLKNAGFLPEERAYLDRVRDELGWIDVGRDFAGPVDGPYTWWSYRGKAFDNDAGWRIDYQLATPELASLASEVVVDRAATYGERWSDHAPLVVDYDV